MLTGILKRRVDAYVDANPYALPASVAEEILDAMMADDALDVDEVDLAHTQVVEYVAEMAS